MPVMTKAAEKFQDVLLEAFVAGTSLAADHGVGEETFCVVCGARLLNVFVTSHGDMGGDCLATITGDNSTRREVVKILKSLNSVYRPIVSVEVRKSFSRSGQIGIFGEFHSDFNAGTFSKCLAVGSSFAVKAAVAVWSDQNGHVPVSWGEVAN